MSMNYAFQPEMVEALATAFHKAWGFISHDPHFATEDEAVLQRALCAFLMQLAADREHDPLRLANGAIARMRREYGRTLPTLSRGSGSSLLPGGQKHVA